MVIDLKRSIDLRWLFDPVLSFILRWSCFEQRNFHCHTFLLYKAKGVSLHSFYSEGEWVNEKLCVALKRKWTYQLREGESSQSSQGRKKGKNKDQFDQAGSMTPLMQMITFSKISQHGCQVYDKYMTYRQPDVVLCWIIFSLTSLLEGKTLQS